MTHIASTPFTSEHRPTRLKQSEKRPPGPLRHTAIHNTFRLLHDTLLHWSVTEQLIPQVKTPTLIIWGKQDTIFDAPTHLQRWHQLAPTPGLWESIRLGSLSRTISLSR